MSGEDKFGHRPFEKLKKLAVAKPKPAKPPAKAKVAPAPRPPASSDDQLFAQAMLNVRPLEPGPQRLLRTPDARLPDPDEEDREVREELQALVEGNAAFQLSDTADFIEGAVADLAKRTRLRLRQGEFALQGHLDLHGLTRDEAHAALAKFIHQHRGAGHRCLLVIHGKGNNSKDQVPVLKEQMSRWLSRGAVGRAVLAFCSARPCDGGAGAVYILLRR